MGAYVVRVEVASESVRIGHRRVRGTPCLIREGVSWRPATGEGNA